MADRRSSKRLQFKKKIKYGTCKPVYDGFTYNISEGGIGIEAKKLLMPKTRIIADLFLGKEISKLQGIIKWSNSSLKGYQSKMGIKITSRPEKIKDIYAKLSTMNINYNVMSEQSDNRLNYDAVPSHILSLEHGLTEHRKCLKDWYRSLLCGLPINNVYLLKDGYLKCDFGKWYRKETSAYLSDNEDFLLINKTHQEMHDITRVWALKSKLEDTITKEDYDLLSEKEQELTKLLLNLKDKFNEEMSKIDFLTGVSTRRPFFQTLSKEHARALRKGEPCVIALIDLDNLKDVNDTYGHLSGDKVLKDAAQYLTYNLRKYDCICRYGGDEFLICLPQTTPDSAREIITRLQMGLSSLPIKLDEDIVVNIGVSVGAVVMANEQSINEIIARVDEALYDAKRRGKNQISFFENKS